MKKFTGFTVVEVMVTVFIFIVVASLSVPLWRHFLVDHRLSIILTELTGAVHFTQEEAISRARIVSLCGSANHKTCDGRWDAGLITMIPDMRKVLRHYPEILKGYHVVWRSNLGLDRSLNFTAGGLTQGQEGSFYICPPHGEAIADRLVVNRLGRLHAEHTPVYPSCP